MKIILSSPLLHNYPNESRIVTELFRKGLSAYHLHKPYFKNSTMAQFLAKIPPEYHKRIMLHCNHGLIAKFNLAGLHFADPEPAKGLLAWWERRRLAPHLHRKETSTHCKKLSDLQDAATLNYSYVLYPLEAVVPGGETNGNEDTIRQALQSSGARVIAVGENGADFITRAAELGFYGIALCNSVWSAQDPVASYHVMVKHCEEAGLILE